MQKLNPEIVVPAKNLPDPDSSPIFERSELLSLEKGADRVFRDNNTENTLEVRVYRDGEAEIENKKYQQPVYHVQLDRHNPSKGVGPAVAHLFTDIIGIDIPSNIIQ